jgi:alpha-D-ribose 1-methylphosphonate 5-triphosphate diphosphatase
MTEQTIFANATLILNDEVVRGSVRLKDGVISDIDSGTSVPAGAFDLGGDYLAPGLVELHTDNLERHLAPRPKVDWPYRAAILAHDRELAGTGITTVFDAIRVGSIISGASKRYGKYARQMADEIQGMREGLDSSFKCNTSRPLGIGCCDGHTKQAPQQRGPWRDISRA